MIRQPLAGTTFLRASLLPEAHQEPVKELLRRYVDLRLKYWPLVDYPAKFAEGRRLVLEIQAELWNHATEAAKKAPTDITATFIEALNEIIDPQRIAAMRRHSRRRVAALNTGCGVRLCHDQLWCWSGRHAVEIG